MLMVHVRMQSREIAILLFTGTSERILFIER